MGHHEYMLIHVTVECFVSIQLKIIDCSCNNFNCYVVSNSEVRHNRRHTYETTA